MVVCCLQLNIDDKSRVLDLDPALSEASLADLRALLQDGSIVKVFHDCQKDVAILYRHYTMSIKNAFDTQVCFSTWISSPCQFTPISNWL